MNASTSAAPSVLEGVLSCRVLDDVGDNHADGASAEDAAPKHRAKLRFLVTKVATSTVASRSLRDGGAHGTRRRALKHEVDVQSRGRVRHSGELGDGDLEVGAGAAKVGPSREDVQREQVAVGREDRQAPPRAMAFHQYQTLRGEEAPRGPKQRVGPCTG